MDNTLDRLRHGRMEGAQRLDLSCGLSSFPPEIFSLADTLEVLNLSGNALSELPDDLPRLHKLKVLFCADNAFTHVPESIGRCAQLSMVGFKANRIAQLSPRALPPALRWLILTDNQLEALPDELGHCTQLQKLMLAGNRLRTLPDSLQHCHRLELLRISANRLTALPDWLTRMPHLSWLAYAGNPFCEADENRAMAASQAHQIDWSSLRIEQQLGEGASGVIHKATWQRDGQPTPVAVKLFKGAMTSDGLPDCEMAACIAADAHPHLIHVHGRISGHPEGRVGLVMQRIDDSFRNLADPPSLASCTRDVYAPDSAFELGALVTLAQGLASAGAHLHAHGILHGDLYAHNTLHNAQGQCLLGDFGAASFLPFAAPAQARALAALEVRAFGHLLEELLIRCQQPAQPPGMLSKLHTLQARCTLADAMARPSLHEVSQALDALVAELPH
ncbi:MAG: leucine-rich repeat-containing protein kinase family protein [Aquabacterium sp.]